MRLASTVIERQLHSPRAVTHFPKCDFKAKFSAHSQHSDVLGQDLPRDGLVSFSPGESNEARHQVMTDPPALLVRPYDDRVFGLQIGRAHV